MDRAEVMAWVAAYESCWRDGDVAGLAEIFTEEAAYHPSPYEPPVVGLDEIGEFWRDDVDRSFEVSAEPVAVEGREAVVRLRVTYLTPRRQEYADLWLLRFAEDGRVERFEEWAYWPGLSLSAPAD